MDLSIVIPTYNERENVFLLYQHIKKALDQITNSYEVIFVDDGSRDGTFRELENIHKKDKKIKIIKFRKNFGQTAAMDAGFKQAKGRVIIPLDADLQNDPKDIPRLLEKINEGYDVVCGWRKNRKDTLMKHLVSRGANLLRKIILDDKIHDSGCTLKAYKKECFEDLDLHGEMHRFIPALLMWKGFKVTEVPVKHHKRRFGQTKYGIKRTVKGFLDMLIIRFWKQYSARPIHLFGSLGMLSIFLGFLIGLYLTILKIFFGQGIGNRPLLLLSILLIIVGVQFFMFGIMTDIMVKSYYQKEKPYKIEKISL
ncbi:glycosyltransferase family 2 protein [Nanoarchaeota archaeon]